jgi:fimbrial isopeptide formation D2 family protein/LPXTG-motif cell wall-anchored protein
MKTTKKIVALVIAMMIVSAMAVSAFALTITVNRDSSYSSGSGVGNQYKWYKVFDASYEGSGTTTGGGSGSYWYKSGTSQNMTVTHSSASYTATQAQADILGTWSDSTGWTRATGNNWFDLVKISGTNTYNVSWSNANTDFATIQAAAKWLIDHNVYTDSGNMTASNGKWTATGRDPGYYVIQGATGASLIAATTDIDINEKNTYPSVDKTQTDKPSGTSGTNNAVNVKVGDKINYEVKVSIPGTVKPGDIIGVWDKPTKGLDFNDDVTVSPATAGGADTATKKTPKTGEAWRWEIKITEANVAALRGTDVIFSFSMTVNANAVVDIGKENESGLEYGDASGTYFEPIPDKVEYKTYFASLKKIDGETEDVLDGVVFQLQDKNGPVFLKQSGTYYYPASGTASGTQGAATTNASGTIYFRGLDKDLENYVVLEISNPHPGYNMLSGTVKLTLAEDTYTVVQSGTTTTTSHFERDKDKVGEVQIVIENNKGAVLPSTGGMGTTILYIAGAILVLGAGILLVTKRRANY